MTARVLVGSGRRVEVEISSSSAVMPPDATNVPYSRAASPRTQPFILEDEAPTSPERRPHPAGRSTFRRMVGRRVLALDVALAVVLTVVAQLELVELHAQAAPEDARGTYPFDVTLALVTTLPLAT